MFTADTIFLFDIFNLRFAELEDGETGDIEG
jgi:hypothetical protein